jgi:hypothetical protein
MPFNKIQIAKLTRIKHLIQDAVNDLTEFNGLLDPGDCKNEYTAERILEASQELDDVGGRLIFELESIINNEK